ncbi:MAG: PAS domain-containing protein [Promethearchaeota archaeon]|nr:MAG: PAS domain-containing protein [Candidatus Lokiarchaeota archaeon]
MKEIGDWYIVKNASKQNKFESEFENNNKLLQITLDAMSESFFLIDSDHKILQCNKATLDILGKSSYDEILGHSCWELVHGTLGPVDWCPVEKMKQTRQREITVQLLNDKWVEISVEPVFNNEREIIGAVHVITDINDRKKAEDALSESEQQYLTILNSLSDAMHVIDRDLRIIYQNPAMNRWLQKLKVNSDIIGKTIFEAFPFL